MTPAPFTFRVSSKDTSSRARCGIFSTPHGSFHTPAFLPVGTKATVKTLSPGELQDLGAEIILNNTYHLYLRPGHKLIHKLGDLHEFQNWHGPILTDSGGFQVFSLAKSRRIKQDGVEFMDEISGKSHFMTPRKAIQIQQALGADIIMAFDECPSGEVDKSYARRSLTTTNAWLKECVATWKHTNRAGKEKLLSQALFGIVQGVTFPDLRVEAAKFVTQFDLPGYAIGGLAVGEKRQAMLEMIEVTEPYLPKNRPRYLMGVGDPSDLVEAVARGMDMFDCVLPTRLGRTSAAFTPNGRINLRNKKYRAMDSPLQKDCACLACQQFSTAYIAHLVREQEILGMRLLTIHNLHFILKLMRDIRDAIKTGTFVKFRKQFTACYKPMRAY